MDKSINESYFYSGNSAKKRTARDQQFSQSYFYSGNSAKKRAARDQQFSQRIDVENEKGKLLQLRKYFCKKFDKFLYFFYQIYTNC